MRPSLLEELLLIAYSDQGTLVTSVAAVDCGLAGAVLMELMLAGRLTLTKRAVTVVSDEPTGDPLLDEALTRIRTSRPAAPRKWVQVLRGGLQDRVLERLVARGVLRREKRRVLLIFPQTRYPSVTGAEPALETDARQRLRAMVTGEGPADPRTAALGALVQAVKLDRRVFPDLSHRERKHRLTAAVASGWPDRTIQQAIKDLQDELAIMAAVVASSAAVSSVTASS